MITFIYDIIFGYVLFFFLEDKFTYIETNKEVSQKNNSSNCLRQLLRFCRLTWHPVPSGFNIMRKRNLKMIVNYHKLNLYVRVG